MVTEGSSSGEPGRETRRAHGETGAAGRPGGGSGPAADHLAVRRLRARDVLAAAALFGARVELDLLKSVTGCPTTAVDEILGSGLLAEDGGWLGFRHEIARLAVEQAISSNARCNARLGTSQEDEGSVAMLNALAVTGAGRTRPDRYRPCRTARTRARV